jgi:hypothetical protein
MTDNLLHLLDDLPAVHVAPGDTVVIEGEATVMIGKRPV